MKPLKIFEKKNKRKWRVSRNGTWRCDGLKTRTNGTTTRQEHEQGTRRPTEWLTSLLCVSLSILMCFTSAARVTMQMSTSLDIQAGVPYIAASTCLRPESTFSHRQDEKNKTKNEEQSFNLSSYLAKAQDTRWCAKRKGIQLKCRTTPLKRRSR